MQIDIKIREDLWKAIEAHYERKDFTEAVRDAVFHMSEVLREKGSIEDKDGSKLVDAALLGNNPAILVNKNETTTEKDFQQGIGFAFKGIMQSVRNLLSHESFKYTQDEAEVLILYINFLLNQVDKSGGTKIDNIIDLLLDDDFTDTQEYAELLLKEVPIKKRYDLLLELYHRRIELPQNRLKYFLSELFASLTKAAKGDFIRVVSSTLMKCKDDNNLRMYCHYFMADTYSDIDRLAQLRIENLIYRSINAGKFENTYILESDSYEKKCNSSGSLSTWITKKLDLLSNKNDIEKLLFTKLNRELSEQEFVFNYFSFAINKKPSEFEKSEIYIIKSQLKKGNSLFSNWLWEDIDLMGNEEYIKLFGDEYEVCKKIIEESKDNELPF